jgi:hypothetical protein
MKSQGGKVETYTGAVDAQVNRVTASGTSTTIENLLGDAGVLPETEEIEILNTGGATVYYRPKGTATTASLPLLNNSSYVLNGPSSELAAAEIITAGADVILYIVQRVSR